MLNLQSGTSLSAPHHDRNIFERCGKIRRGHAISDGMPRVAGSASPPHPFHRGFQRVERAGADVAITTLRASTVRAVKINQFALPCYPHERPADVFGPTAPTAARVRTVRPHQEPRSAGRWRVDSSDRDGGPWDAFVEPPVMDEAAGGVQPFR